MKLLEKGGFIRWLPGPGIEKNRVNYGAFEVKSGEVISLGALNYIDGRLEHEDHFEELHQQLLESDKPELASKLKRGKFYKSGSFVMTDKDSGVKVIPIEVIEQQRKNLTQEIARRLGKST